MKHLSQVALGVTGLALIGLAGGLHLPDKKLQAAGDLDVFPSNSRLSFLGEVASSTGTTNVSGTSILYIKTAQSETDGIYATSSAQLTAGDIIYFKGNETADATTHNVSYTVATTNVTLPDNQIPLTNVLAANTNGETIYNKMTGEVKFSYTPDDSAAATGGKLVLYIPAADNTAASNDGVPDSGGFDFNSIDYATNVTCPTGWAATGSEAAPSSTNGVIIGNTAYHTITCVHDGTTAISASTPLEIKVTGLINPAPEYRVRNENGEYYTYDGTALNADEAGVGMMDSYAFRVAQLNSTGVSVKNTNTYVAYSNAVKMTVRVMPQLTYKIEGLTASAVTTAGICNIASTGETTVDSSAYQIDFGSIGNTYFTNAAQKMTVTTNAAHGYVVSARYEDQMAYSENGHRKYACANDGDLAYCIPGVPHTTANDDKLTARTWAVTDGRGFGYSLEIADGDSYLNGDAVNVTLPTTFATDGHMSNETSATGKSYTKVDSAQYQKWRSFADAENNDDPVQIFSNLRSTNKDEVYVCYRIMASVDNVPGDYQTTVVYTITATF